MGKGSNSTSSTSSGTTTAAPDSNAYQAYLALLNRAQGVASTPYQAYSGEETAPINAQQTAGIGAINQYTGDISATGAPLTASDIKQYENPYTQDVINATQADFDVQNQRANSTVTGNAGAQGALGGDRVAVAQALTQESQNRTQAPVIAGLRSAGYQQAVSTAENQQQQALRAKQAALTGAQAQVGAGTLQQNTQQSADTQQRQDYYQQQGYPFQVAQWLASITTGVGSQLGGTSSTNQTGQTSGPTPNPWSQVAGLGIAALGAFSDRRTKENIDKIGKTNDGQTIYRFNYKGSPQTQIGLMHDEVEEHHPEATGRISGVGIVDYRKATDDSVRKFSGGRVAGFAGGGTPSSPYGSDQSWVPQLGITGGRGAPSAPSTHAPSAPQQQQAGLSGDQMKGIAVGGKKLYDAYDNYADPGSAANPLEGLTAEDYGAWRGGRVKRYANGGFADGGDPTFDERFDASYPRSVTAGLGASSPAVVDSGEPIRLDPEATDRWRKGVVRDNGPEIASVAKDQDAPVSGDIADNDNGPKPGVGPVAAISRAIKAPAESADEPSEAMAYDRPDRSMRSAAPPEGVSAPSNDSFLGRLGINVTPEFRQGLIQAGLSMMANRRGGPGSFLGAAGEGGMAGIGAYSKAQELEYQHQLESTKTQMALDDRNLKQASSPLIRDARGNMTVNPAWVSMKQKEAEITQKEKYSPAGSIVTPEGAVHPLVLETTSGAIKDAVTGKPPTSADKITPKGSPKEASLSDEDAAAIARYTVATGDDSRLRSLGFNPQNKSKVQSYVTKEMTDKSVSDEEMAKRRQEFAAEGISKNAAARTRSTREENLNLVLRAANAAIPAALEESEKVQRYTGYVPLDRLIQHGQVTTNDPNLVTFGMANLQLAEHWARAMNPMGVMRESDRDLALKFLDTAFSKNTYKQAVMQLQKQITRERDAIHEGKPGHAESGSVVPGQVQKSDEGKKAAETGETPTVTSKDEYEKLKPGSKFKDKAGKEWTKP